MNQTEEILKDRLKSISNVVLMQDITDTDELKHIKDSISFDDESVQTKLSPEEIIQLKSLGVDVDHILVKLFNELCLTIQYKLENYLPKCDVAIDESCESLIDYITTSKSKSIICSAGRLCNIQQHTTFLPVYDPAKDELIYKAGQINSSSDLNTWIYVDPFMKWNDTTIYTSENDYLCTIYIDTLNVKKTIDEDNKFGFEISVRYALK